MALLENWQKVAYNEKTNKQELQRFWQRYFLVEKGVYEKLLVNPDEKGHPQFFLLTAGL